MIINGCLKSRLPASLNISILEDSEILISKLKYGYSSGSACSSTDIELSAVLTGMGLKEYIAKSALRIGLGRFTTKSDIINAVNEITTVAKEIKNNAFNNN